MSSKLNRTTGLVHLIIFCLAQLFLWHHQRVKLYSYLFGSLEYETRYKETILYKTFQNDYLWDSLEVKSWLSLIES